MAPGVVMNTSQTQIQVQLQRKHEELEQLISKQKEELRLVREQLMMAGCGLLPSIVNVPMSFSNTVNNSRSIASTVPDMIQPHQQQLVHATQMSMQQLTPVDMPRHSGMESVESQRVDVANLGPSTSAQDDEMISYMQLAPVPVSHLHHMRIQTDNQAQNQGQPQPEQQPQQQAQSAQMQQMPITNDLEVLPYQMSQEQSQILFNAPNSPGHT